MEQLINFKFELVEKLSVCFVRGNRDKLNLLFGKFIKFFETREKMLHIWLHQKQSIEVMKKKNTITLGEITFFDHVNTWPILLSLNARLTNNQNYTERVRN